MRMRSFRVHRCQMVKVVFLCKGTRGDVLPLLCIALHYQEKYKDSVVVFACTPSSLDAHIKTTVQQRAQSGRCIELWDLPDHHVLLASHSGKDKDAATKRLQDEERLSLLQSEAAVCLQVSLGADLLVFNLFSLEGHFIASHLNIPAIVASPHLLTRSIPTSFEAKLAEAQPELYHRLKAATPGLEVCYGEVEHWMWRLFLDDYGCACESLGLPALPLSLSPSGALPPPTPLLYGISPSVISRQPYWPDSVSLCGYWSTPPGLYPTPDPNLETLLHSLPSPPLYVGFGSMEPYLLDMDWTALFATLEKVLESHAMDALFQCQGNGPISQAYSSLATKPKHIHLWTQALSHRWLFPQCSVILHHGGSGTVATCLLSRKPQIISPVMFDQSMWAEHLSWMGVAYQCPPPGQLTAQNLTHALKIVTGEGVGKRVGELSEKLVGENGVELAEKEMEKCLDRK